MMIKQWMRGLARVRTFIPSHITSPRGLGLRPHPDPSAEKGNDAHLISGRFKMQVFVARVRLCNGHCSYCR